VGIAAQAVNTLTERGRRVRLVSMPATDIFDAQDAAYRESVLPKAVRRRLAVEAGATLGWWHYVGSDGRVLGIDRFGASGKASDLFPHFGFTADNVVLQVEELMKC
jgi:transketolase